MRRQLPVTLTTQWQWRAALPSLGFFLAAWLPLAAQTPAPPPITTDRPAFTNSSIVVPRGTLQLENGFLETTTSGQRTFDLPETLLRWGIAGKTELRFTLPDYFHNPDTGPGAAIGWSDLSIGIKQQLGPIHGFDVSLMATLSFPTGANTISSHGYDPQLQLPWSRKVSVNWTAAGMLSVSWPTQGLSRNTTGQATFLFDRQLSSPWDAFIEYAANLPERGGPQHILHLGTAYKLTPRQQLDFRIGFGLSSSAPDHFIGFGYSVLLGK